MSQTGDIPLKSHRLPRYLPRFYVEFFRFEALTQG